MAMQSQLWSLSALATELQTDRRTLAKRLETLPPAEEKKTDKRTNKLWRMSDVVEHLETQKSENGKSYDKNAEEARLKFHQANNEAMKEKELSGRLLPVEEVIQLGKAMVYAAKNKLLRIPDRVRQHTPDIEPEIINVIEQAVQEALEELGRDGIPSQFKERISKYRSELDSGEEDEAGE